MSALKIIILWGICSVLLLAAAAGLRFPELHWPWWQYLLMLNAGAVSAYLAGSLTDGTAINPKVLAVLIVVGAPAILAVVVLASLCLFAALVPSRRVHRLTADGEVKNHMPEGSAALAQ